LTGTAKKLENLIFTAGNYGEVDLTAGGEIFVVEGDGGGVGGKDGGAGEGVGVGKVANGDIGGFCGGGDDETGIVGCLKKRSVDSGWNG